MSTLYVRNVPEDLYEQLRRQAAARGVSIAAETIRLLQQAVGRRPPAPRHLLEEIERERPELGWSSAEAVELIRNRRGGAQSGTPPGREDRAAPAPPPEDR